MADPLLAALRESATPALYQRNTFRVTGLPTDADRRTVRQRRQKVLTLIEVGAQAAATDPHEVTRAFDVILGDPRRRLVDELFWLWDTEGASCPCPTGLHRDHDAAVRAHSDVLEREAGSAGLSADELRELDDAWDTASTHWAGLLRRVALWDHVRHRITTLDDKQLDESAIDLIRGELPAVLVTPMIVLATGRPAALRRAALAWPAPRDVVVDQLEITAEPIYRSVITAVRAGREALETGNPIDVANQLRRAVMPPLRQLDELVPADEHRRTTRARNDVAIIFNNCALDLIEARGAPADKAARRWLTTAKELASDPQTLAAIEKNTAFLDRLVQSERVADYLRVGGDSPPPPALSRGQVAMLLLLLALFLTVICLANYDG